MVSAARAIARRGKMSGRVGLFVLALFTLAGLVLAGLMMSVAWEHNAQGEIHNEDGVDWGYWLLIGFSWFISVTAVPYAIAACVLAYRYFVRRGETSSTSTI